MGNKISKILQGIEHNKRFTEIRDAFYDQYLMLQEIDLHQEPQELGIKLFVTFRYDTQRIENAFPDFRREPDLWITANGIRYKDSKIYQFSSMISEIELRQARIPEPDLALWEFIFRSIRTLINERGLKHKLIVVKTKRGPDGKPILEEIDSRGKFLEF